MTLAVSTSRRWAAVRPYVQIARVDHWFKNVFMVLGVVLALAYRPELCGWATVPLMAWAILATCIICSSNYVLNELLDAAYDHQHPTKQFRPAAMGLVRSKIALTEFGLLAAVGLSIGFAINKPFALSLLGLWLMGCVYNVRPIRSKDIPYLDVLSESINNPIRLLLGWFALVPEMLPPVSLILAYWMVGAFFMATKRFAEFRYIGDEACAARYRKSFAHYNESRLLISMMFYVTAGALLSGFFIVRFKLELILSVPVIAGFFAYYLLLGLKPNSPVQAPEKLYKERGFLLYSIATTVVFVVLMFVHIPELYELFNVEPKSAQHLLWQMPEVTR